MFSRSLSERLDSLIDDLIMDGGIEAASLASILLAAKDSVNHDYHLTLSRWVWGAVNEMKADLYQIQDEEKVTIEDNPVIGRGRRQKG